MTRRALVLALAVGLLLTPGCITFYGDDTVEVRFLVTRDVGTEVLTDENLTMPEGSSAMDALHEIAEVETSHGGGFVEAIDGIDSRYPDEKVDWLYHVNTRIAEVGSAQYTLQESDVLLYDYRDWSRAIDLPHVLTGLDDWPVDLDDPAFDRVAFEAHHADDHTRGHLYAEVDGEQLTLLDADGDPARNLTPPWLLAHAVDGPTDDPRILLVPSDEEARGLVHELAQIRPTGVGAAITPNATLEVPAG